MKKIYGLFFSYREVNLFIAYSNKKKKIMRYLCDTLKINEDDMELFSIQEINEEWLQGIHQYELSILMEENNFMLTSIEWEIIHKEYKLFQNRFDGSFQRELKVFGLSMDDFGRYHLNIAIESISSYSNKEFENRLYKGFILSHSLLNSDGTIQAFTNRLEMINSFREGKLLDSECDMYSDLYYT